jgi:hypothetical protein
MTSKAATAEATVSLRITPYAKFKKYGEPHSPRALTYAKETTPSLL